MLDLNLIEKYNFSSIRFSMFSGSACPKHILKTYREKILIQNRNTRIGQLWGMTETAGATFCRDSGPIDLPLTSAGPAAPGNEVRVVSRDDGAVLSPNIEGELQVRGSSVFPGYFDNPEANKASFTKDGWFKTGDLAMLDQDENLIMTGRIKDIISRGGVKFNPADIEELIMSHPNITQAAIVPMPDKVLGERACCFVTVTQSKNINLKEICMFLNSKKISKNKWPERLEIIKEMPLTPTKKVIKSKLLEKL